MNRHPRQPPDGGDEPDVEETVHLALQVAEDTCLDHFVFCCPMCFETDPEGSAGI